MATVQISRGESGKIVVSIDGYDEISLRDEITELDALDGSELDDEEVAQLLAAFARPAIEFAAKMLGMRMMTRVMLIRRLREKGIDPTLAEIAADKMNEVKALNDLDYATTFAKDRAARGWGEIRIRDELRFRGVSEDNVEKAVETLDDSSDAIEVFIERKAKGELFSRKEADKVGAALARKGFRWEDIRPILREYTED